MKDPVPWINEVPGKSGGHGGDGGDGGHGGVGGGGIPDQQKHRYEDVHEAVLALLMLKCRNPLECTQQ